MRILFVAPRFHTNQYQIVKTLMENNHEVFFNVSYLGSTEDHSLLKPVSFRQSSLSLLIEKAIGKGGIKKPYFFPNVAVYWKYFKDLRPEIVVIRDPYKYFSVIAAFCALITKAKIIFYTQEELYRSRPKLAAMKQKFFIELFRAAWMTPITGNQNGKNSKPDHMYYVPLPIPLKPTYGNSSNRSYELPKILMIGKYHQDRKKHLLLVEAVSLLRSKYDFEVTFVGECVTEEQLKKYKIIEEVIQRKGLTEIVYLRKNIPFEQMQDLYTSHHIFVLPAINEQYGISTTEALGYGLPVICTDTCGARFNITNGENGYIVKSNSLEELTAALEALISDKKRTEKMSENSLDYVRSNLSGSAFYKKFTHMISDRFQLQLLDNAVH